jgi:hypothetical protein
MHIESITFINVYIHICVQYVRKGNEIKQGYQMVQVHTKKSNLGKFWWAFEWKMLVYYMVIW